MLLDNHIAGFINQPYLNSNSVSQHGLLEVGIDRRMIKGDLKIFSQAESQKYF